MSIVFFNIHSFIYLSVHSFVCLYWFVCLFCPCFSGNVRGRGLDIRVSVQDKAGSVETYSVSTRSVDYTKWNLIRVRFEDSALSSTIKIFLNDKMVKVDSFSWFDDFVAGSNLRLAQIYEIYQEDSGTIKYKFKVSCGPLQRRIWFVRTIFWFGELSVHQINKNYRFPLSKR